MDAGCGEQNTPKRTQNVPGNFPESPGPCSKPRFPLGSPWRSHCASKSAGRCGQDGCQSRPRYFVVFKMSRCGKEAFSSWSCKATRPQAIQPVKKKARSKDAVARAAPTILAYHFPEGPVLAEPERAPKLLELENWRPFLCQFLACMRIGNWRRTG